MNEQMQLMAKYLVPLSSMNICKYETNRHKTNKQKLTGEKLTGMKRYGMKQVWECYFLH